MASIDKCKPCDKKECFGCEECRCIVLVDNNFGNKACPFFKTREQVEKEQEYVRQRLETRQIKAKAF